MDDRDFITKNIEEFKKQLKQHQESPECTHKPDCPKCIYLKNCIMQEEAALNEIGRI